MSIASPRDGYYDEAGHWQCTKFCFIACPPERCTCQPPGGLYFKPSPPPGVIEINLNDATPVVVVSLEDENETDTE